MAPKNKRPRSERREIERALRKQVQQRARLIVAAPGGDPEHPIVVSSASVVEGNARSTPCGHCGGQLDLQHHTASAAELRKVQLICRLCHAPRVLWFRIEEPLAN